MKGKKSDLLFVNQFIEQCVSNNIFGAEDIVKKAYSDIQDIDIKIKAVEELKKKRAKLLDVVTALDKSSIKKESPSSDIKLLFLFKIPNPDIGSVICKKIKDNPIQIESIKKINNYSDVSFIVKQLLENKVISKQGNYLLRGEMFDIYMKNIVQEYE